MLELERDRAPADLRDRTARVNRVDKETQIDVNVWLDREGGSEIKTGVGFFDHMLDQIATHGGFRMERSTSSDLYIDDHHTVEDTALALGEALNKALGDKRGILRFGFVLPMDGVPGTALDISGRPHLEYKAEFNYQRVGDLSTEMVEHSSVRSLTPWGCTLHPEDQAKRPPPGRACSKCLAAALRQAIRVEGNTLPSSKGSAVMNVVIWIPAAPTWPPSPTRRRLGYQPEVSRDPEIVLRADKLFPHRASAPRRRRWINCANGIWSELIKACTQPVLGICLVHAAACGQQRRERRRDDTRPLSIRR